MPSAQHHLAKVQQDAAMEKAAEAFYQEKRGASAIIKKHFIFGHITQQQVNDSAHLRSLSLYEGLERDGASCDSDDTAGSVWGSLGA